MRRRHFLAGSAAPLLGCTPAPEIAGGFTDAAHERGHLLRQSASWPSPAVTRRVGVLVAGGGMAGLAATRALRLQGQDDFALLELHDSAGGNSRGTMLGGMACPLGAHYLPLPGDDAPEVQDWLEELGLRQRRSGRWVYDERHLCHSPQERLFFQGHWQDGLLPMQGVGGTTLAQYQRFATLVSQAQKAARWGVPAARHAPNAWQRSLAGQTFAHYLNQQALTDAHLRWYLNYCCRDEYGAGTATVSAWAGLHYFASRHGFHAPSGEQSPEQPRDAVLTWPEGNAWLVQRLAAPLGERLHTGQLIVRIDEQRHGVLVDAWNPRTAVLQRWLAQRVIVALPVLSAARVLRQPPVWLTQAAARVRYAPWLVANLQLNAALHDRPGAAPSWDNVIYNSAGLGYINARHQSLHPVAGAAVLTWYLALGDHADGRAQLLQQPWSAWRDRILAELASAHPDLPGKTVRLELTRHGHAMAIPQPNDQGQIGLWPTQNVRKQLLISEQLPRIGKRLVFAHSDWAGYSVLEEAFTMGHHAAIA